MNSIVQDSQFLQGLQLLDEQDWQKANEHFNQLIEKNYYPSYAYFYRSWALLNLNQIEQADDDLQSASIIDPSCLQTLVQIVKDCESAITLFTKCYYLKVQGRLEETIQQCDLLLQKSENYQLALYLKCDALFDLKIYDEAIFWSTILLSQNDNLQIGQLVKGDALQSLGSYDEAVICFQKAIEINSLTLDPYLMLCETLLKQEKYHECLLVCDLGIVIRKEYRLFKVKAFALFQQKEFEAAVHGFNEILKIQQEYEVLVKKGVALIEMKKFSESIDILDQAIDINASNADVILKKSLALCELDNFSQSLYFCNIVLEINPEHCLANHLKGQTLNIISSTAISSIWNQESNSISSYILKF